MTKLPIGTDREVQIRVTSTMTFNVRVVAFYRTLSLFPFSPNVATTQTPKALYNKHNNGSTNINSNRLSEKQYYYSPKRQPQTDTSLTAAAQTPTAVGYRSNCFFLMFFVGYLLHNVGGINIPPARCEQENVQMLTNRQNTCSEVSTDIPLHSFGALRRPTAVKAFSDRSIDVVFGLCVIISA